MNEEKQLELLRAVVQVQGQILQYLEAERDDSGPSYRTMAELQSKLHDDEHDAN